MIEDYEKGLDYFIDEPIKDCVAFLNLLGFKTRWSCCGFDYKNQLDIKSHTINRPHIYLTYVISKGLDFLVRICVESGWSLRLTKVSCDICWEISCGLSLDPNWDKKESIHNYESSVVAIENLRRTLLKYKEYFLEGVILEDENIRMKDLMSNWQYPLSLPWIIRKKELNLDSKENPISVQNEEIFNNIEI